MTELTATKEWKEHEKYMREAIRQAKKAYVLTEVDRL